MRRGIGDIDCVVFFVYVWVVSGDEFVVYVVVDYFMVKEVYVVGDLGVVYFVEIVWWI